MSTEKHKVVCANCGRELPVASEADGVIVVNTCGTCALGDFLLLKALSGTMTMVGQPTRDNA